MKKIIILLILVILSGCANKPEYVGEKEVPMELYLTNNCYILNENIRNQTEHVKTLTLKQETTANLDAGWVLFIGLPLGSMSDGDVEEELSTAKGELTAMRHAKIESGCLK